MKLSVAHAGLVALALSVAAGAQASDIKEVHKTVALDKDGSVSIHTYKGNVTVTTWDKPEIQIDARIEPGSDDRYDIEKVEWTEVRISGSGSSVHIESDYDAVKRHEHHGFLGLFDWDSGSLPYVRYTIQMPATASLAIDDYKSDNKVSDLRADLKLNTYKGTGRITNLDGAARVETYKGDVRVEFAKFSKASRFETYKGEVEVRVPRDSKFEMDSDYSRHGNISSDFPMMTRAGRWDGAHASGAVNGGGPELRISTYKGTVRVRAK